jgi:hypothetical protein
MARQMPTDPENVLRAPALAGARVTRDDRQSRFWRIYCHFRGWTISVWNEWPQPIPRSRSPCASRDCPLAIYAAIAFFAA